MKPEPTHLSPKDVLRGAAHELSRIQKAHRYVPLPLNTSLRVTYGEEMVGDRPVPQMARVVYHTAAVYPLGGSSWAVAVGEAEPQPRGPYVADVIASRIANGNGHMPGGQELAGIIRRRGLVDSLVTVAPDGRFLTNDKSRFQKPVVSALSPRRADDLLGAFVTQKRPREYRVEAPRHLAVVMEEVLNHA